MGVLVIHDDALRMLKELAFRQNVPVEGLTRKMIFQYADQYEKQTPQNDLSEMRKYDRKKTNWDAKLQFQFAGDASDARVPWKLKNHFHERHLFLI